MKKNKNIKLTIIITDLSLGGAQMMLLKLMQGIDRSRFNPTIISLTMVGEIGKHIEDLGIPVKALLMKPGFPSPFKFIELVKQLREIKPDVVNTWMYHADLFGGVAARLAGVRGLTWGIRHSDLSENKNKKSTLRIMRLCAKISSWLPRAILSCSERAKINHIEAGYCARKFTVITNGFDLSRFVPDAGAKVSICAELGLYPDVLLVGLIGRIDPQKNHEGFIEAAAMVAHALPKVHFLLAGSGVDYGNLHLNNLIAKTDFQERFHLLGRRDDMPHLMASLDLLASSSWGEAFPNVLGEAMASGVPCVVTDVGDSAWIVGETGRVVPAGEMLELAQAIQELLEISSFERLELGVLARKRVAEFFEIRSVVRQYETFYTSLAEERCQ
jgi:glycosyltransferase involved in cell wall biosynthesis